jgi:hypothetical protein
MEVSVNAKEFGKAIDELLAGRSEREIRADEVDLAAGNSELTLKTTGTGTSVDARLVVAGVCRIPLTVLEKLGKALATFKNEDATLAVERGKLKLNSVRISDERIVKLRSAMRVVDLPMNAHIGDVLVTAERYTPRQLSQSGLSGRVQDARIEARNLIADAAKTLEPLGISQRQIEGLVTQTLRAKAAKA